MTQSSRRLRGLGWALLGVVIVLPIAGGLVGVKLRQFGTMAEVGASFVPPPTPVNVAEALLRTWTPRLAAVGTVAAYQGTVVSTEADGVVREILFEPGAEARAGAVLVRLDDEVEQARLRAAEAAVELARLQDQRVRELISSRSISQGDVDLAAANLAQARAQADEVRAQIAKKAIRAPFTGRLGIRHIHVGQYLSTGSPVVSLQALDPVYVEFSLPQQRLGELAAGLAVEATSDAYPEARFAGRITAINPQIDQATRNVRVQATLANPDGRLRPGMYVAIDTLLPRTEELLFIPTTAVNHAPYGDSVYVLEEGEAGPDGTRPLVLRQQLVRLGLRQGDFVAVTEGLAAGQRIVSTGVFKLSPGMPVVVDNSLAPEFSFAPRPDNS